MDATDLEGLAKADERPYSSYRPFLAVIFGYPFAQCPLPLDIRRLERGTAAVLPRKP